MYGKIFVQIYDGSLYGRWQALVTFQQLIVLADQDGTIDMMPEAISARTSIPLEIIRQGLSELEQADPRSRTPDEDGRRIIRISDTRDWGWQITNYAHYRAIRTAEERREYFKEHKRKQRAKRNSDGVTHNGTDVNPSPPLSTASPLSPPIVEVEVKVEAEVKAEDTTAMAQIFRDKELLLVKEFGALWAPVADFIDSKRNRGAWISEMATLAIAYPPEDISRAAADCLALDDPIRSPKAFRVFVASAKEERIGGSRTPTAKAASRGGARADSTLDDWTDGN